MPFGLAMLENLSAFFEPIREIRGGIPSFKVFIHGLWLGASGGGTLPVDSPIDDSIVAHVPDSSATDVDAAVDAAAEGRRAIQGTPGVSRLELLERARGLLLRYRRDFEMVLTAEAGKPPKDAEGEVSATADRLALAAQESREIAGEFIPGEWTKDARGRGAIVVRVPLGIVAAICPFNYPLFIAAAKAIPALLAGNAVVLKPASDTPLSMLLFARVLEEAGVPAGAFNVVTGRGAFVGEALASNSKVAMVSFTGSTEAPFETASRMRPCACLAAAALITGPTRTPGSRGSPTFHSATSDSSSLTRGSAIASTAMTAEIASHRCPAFFREPSTHLCAAKCRSASSRTMAIPLPPSSRWSFLIPAARTMASPTSVLPVKETMATFEFEARASPTKAPTPL
jgi:hypothetical protein